MRRLHRGVIWASSRISSAYRPCAVKVTEEKEKPTEVVQKKPTLLQFLRSVDHRKITQQPPRDIIRATVALLQYFDRMENARRRGGPLDRLLLKVSAERIPRIQCHAMFSGAAFVVEHRLVSVENAIALLKYRWPDQFSDERHFVRLQLRGWVTELLNEGKLNPAQARMILRSSCISFKRQVPLIGSLARKATEDLSEMTDVDDILGVMWAVCDARTHAPVSFWDKSTRRILSLHFDARRGSAEPSAAATVPMKPRQVFRLLRVLKKEGQSSRAAQLLQIAEEQAEVIGKSFEAENYSRKISSPLPKRVLIERCVKHTGMSPEELLSFLHICGELGMSYSRYWEPLTDPVLCPMMPYLRRKQLVLMVESLVALRCRSVPVLQALIDHLANRGISHPSSLELLMKVSRMIAPQQLLHTQLNLAHFLEHLASAAEEKRKLTDLEMMRLTQEMYLFTRHLSAEASAKKMLLKAVDEFCFQLDRMLERGFASVDCCNTVLEHTIMLGMRSKSALYPNMTKLLERRNAIYKDQHTAISISTGPTAPFAQVSIYRQVFYLVQQMTFNRREVKRELLEGLYTSVRQLGLVPFFRSMRTLAFLHQPQGATEENSRIIPPILHTIVCNAVVNRIRESEATADSNHRLVDFVLGIDSTAEKNFMRSLLNDIKACPFVLVKQNADLWKFVAVVAKIHGSASEQELVKAVLGKAI